MKKMATLIRLQRRELDELRQRMVRLENRRDHYIRQIEELAQSLEQEYLLAEKLPDMRGFFGDFSGSIKKRQTILAAHVIQAETQIQQLLVQIHQQFSELKKYEIAKERFDANAALIAKRKEQLAMDEIGIRNAIFFHAD